MKRTQKNEGKFKNLVINVCYNKTFYIILGSVFSITLIFYLLDLYKASLLIILYNISAELIFVASAIRRNDISILRENKLINVVLKDYDSVNFLLILFGVKLTSEITKFVCICTNFECSFISYLCAFLSLLAIFMFISDKLTKEINNYFSEKIIRNNIIRLY